MKKLNRSLMLDLFLLCMAVVLSVLVRYEGWRSVPLANPDLVPYFLGAETQLHTGQFLDHGDLSSYNSFAPPGTVYWVLLGAPFMSDLRLYTLPANLLINLASVILLYFLLRKVLGRATALVAGLVYGFSQLGYQSIWPIGHPIYILLILAFTVWWIRRRNPWALFAAAVVGAFGIYVDLAILPFLFVPLVAWLMFRPPLRVLPLLASLAAGLLIWFPFLRYEAPKNFIDIRSILFLTPVSADGVLESKAAPPYCLATLPGEPDVRDGVYIPYINSAEENRLVFPLPGLKPSLYYHVCTVLLNVDRNFDEESFFSPSPALGVICWLFFMIGLCQSAAMLVPSEWTRRGWSARLQYAPVWVVTVFSLALAAVVFLGLGWLIRHAWAAKDHSFLLIAIQIQYFLPLILIAFLVGLYLGWQQPREDPTKVYILFAIWIPWLLVVLLAEPGRPERFWWLWPLQVAVAVMALHCLIQAWTHSRWVKWIVSIAAIVAVYPVPTYLPRIQEVLARGYSGEDSAQIQAVDYIGRTVVGAGENQIMAGYQWGAAATGPIAKDPTLWPGSWFDLLLQTRWGVENMDHDPQGISRSDNWRIWIPAQGDCQAENAQQLAWTNFQLVFHSGPYCVFEVGSAH